MARILSCSTALALCLWAQAVQADVTPEDVWQNWQALAASTGQDMTFDSATRTGDTLKVSGLLLTFTDDMGGSFSANLDQMDFKDNGDGTVAVTMAESYPMTLAFPQDGEGPTSIKLTVTQPGLVITAAGSPAETSYDFAAPTVGVKLDEVVDADGQPLDTQADLVMTDMTARYLVVSEAEATQLDSSLSAGSLALNLSGKGVDGAGEGTITLSVADLAGTTKGNFLGAEIMANMAAALNAGFTTQSSFNFGALSLNADIVEAGGPVKLAGTLAGGGFDAAMNKDRMNYGTSFTGGNFTASGPEIPFPEVVVGFAETAFSILMPVSKSDTPQDFALETRLVDVTVSEDVWGLVDPGAALSREPATFIFDVKGTGFWKQDIMDPALDMESVEPPGELTSLDLTQILVKAAGAEVGAVGGLTFDNTNLATFEGMPAPTGNINVTIKGVNALIDNLIAMGLLPDDQAMGARMMLGMFARPGAAPDELTSLIEFRDGGLFANGQQLQ